ncbi:MAG TPA: hypothetical protein VF698_05690, partial [Thermoanaerobaculia bacterium]
VVPTASTTSGTEITTSTAATNTPIPAGKGVLLLSATPWGDVDKIVSADNTEVPLTEDARSTPARIALDPGKYTVTLSGPAGTQTVDVQITAGQRVPKKIDLGIVDYDQLEKEMSQQ